MESNLIEHRINRINHLLERLEAIPQELDEIYGELFGRYLTRKKFTDLVNRRQNLMVEKQNKERELKEVYRMIEIDEEDF